MLQHFLNLKILVIVQKPSAFEPEWQTRNHSEFKPCDNDFPLKPNPIQRAFNLFPAVHYTIGKFQRLIEA